jgi:hypothetical protein
MAPKKLMKGMASIFTQALVHLLQPLVDEGADEFVERVQQRFRSVCDALA